MEAAALVQQMSVQVVADVRRHAEPDALERVGRDEAGHSAHDEHGEHQQRREDVNVGLGDSEQPLEGLVVLFRVELSEQIGETGARLFLPLQQVRTVIHLWQVPWIGTAIFWFMFLSFAVKVPVFPLHTWLPDAHVEAPTAGSVILAAVLLKMGTYGFVRFALPLFPVASVEYAPVIFTLALIGILYGALVAMVQPDVKKLVAYSSVAHLGFCMLGLFAMENRAVAGSVYQMLNHGLSTGALFLLVGMIYDRRHTRLIADYGGIARVMPHFTFVFLFTTLASIGLPGLSSFVNYAQGNTPDSGSNASPDQREGLEESGVNRLAPH